MENYLPLLQSTSLFAGLEAESLRVLLGNVGAVLRTYSRGETLVLAGQTNRRVGVVLSGTIEAYHPAASGARLPINQMGPGGVFGDVLGGSSLSSPVTVMASAPCEVLLMPYEKLLLPGADPARQREVHHSLTFTIPYSRIQLADYLNCDRSALSRELSLMQRDGLLETYRSSFKLLEPEALRRMVL